MYLLQLENDDNVSLVRVDDTSIPKYGILSHTWGDDDDEVTFEDLENTVSKHRAGASRALNREVPSPLAPSKHVEDHVKAKIGYQKIKFCGTQAKRDGLDYFWVDSCCIDKRSSAELQEAITSMFRYYQNSVHCYVYLVDVSKNEHDANDMLKDRMMDARWWSRGFTLQELIAPPSVQFFSKEENYLGDKSSFEDIIERRTGIAKSVLRGESLSNYSIETRLSWANGRETKREEDESYSLMGIFGISMPVMYGELRQNAKRRLLQTIRDSETLVSLGTEGRRKVNQIGLSLNFKRIDARELTIQDALRETCAWILRTTEYKDWMDVNKSDEHYGLLWIKGHPGTGKSTLMKYILGHTLQTMTGKKHRRYVGATGEVIVAFFFNARGEILERSILGMYRSILLQILTAQPDLWGLVLELLKFCAGDFSTDFDPNFEWTVERLVTLIGAVVAEIQQPITCFIDALDECQDEEVRDMLQFMTRIGRESLSRGKGFRVCLASRYYPAVSVPGGLSLELEAQEGHDKDIRSYVRSELHIGQSITSRKIQQDLIAKAIHIFLWVVLVVGILNQEYDSGRVHTLRRRFDEIPDDLHDLLRDILLRDTRNRAELLLCIQWVLFAKIPLHPRQLRLAILAGTDEEAFLDMGDEEIPPFVIRRYILDVSKGLCGITAGHQPKVQFIHESVRDLLLKEQGLRHVWPELCEDLSRQSYRRLGQVCFRYLSLGVRKFLRDNNAPEDHYGSSLEFKEHALSYILPYRKSGGDTGPVQETIVWHGPIDLQRHAESHRFQQAEELRPCHPKHTLHLILVDHPRPMWCYVDINPSGKYTYDIQNLTAGEPIAKGRSFSLQCSGFLSNIAELENEWALSFFLETGKFQINERSCSGQTALEKVLSMWVPDFEDLTQQRVRVIFSGEGSFPGITQASRRLSVISTLLYADARTTAEGSHCDINWSVIQKSTASFERRASDAFTRISADFYGTTKIAREQRRYHLLLIALLAGYSDAATAILEYGHRSHIPIFVRDYDEWEKIYCV